MPALLIYYRLIYRNKLAYQKSTQVEVLIASSALNAI